ncbi:MAG: putative anti-sigma regulatory factor, serine/threonine protein kinase [Chlorobi bacterium]|nr:putative anti-sigma regulatory factor, serine/threonine protein kinase [Chlorobiota bacterium]
MPVIRDELMQVRASDDIVRVRQMVRALAVELGFGLVDQTKIVTAASELARNTLDYGLGGTTLMEVLEENSRIGLRITFEDNGPGIADIDLAMTDGYTSGRGLGLGLSGAKRLSNEFTIESRVGEGTRIAITRWKGR